MIVVLKDGAISEVGTYQELLDKKGAFSEFLTTHMQDFERERAEGEMTQTYFLSLDLF